MFHFPDSLFHFLRIPCSTSSGFRVPLPPEYPRAAVDGHLKRPIRTDPVLDRIAQRGVEHEKRFLEELTGDDLSVVEIPRDETLPRAERLVRGREATIEAMRDGADVIYQAVLLEGRRLGYVDFLRRVEQPSDLGSWRYEVWDTKLARHAKASAVLQLSMYSELLEAVQGRAPEEMHLALGGVMREKISFRVADYAAYYRSVASGFEAVLDDDGPSFPVPTTSGHWMACSPSQPSCGHRIGASARCSAEDFQRQEHLSQTTVIQRDDCFFFRSSIWRRGAGHGPSCSKTGRTHEGTAVASGYPAVAHVPFCRDLTVTSE